LPQVIDDESGRTLAAASTLTADIKTSIEGNGANVVST
jgi:ribosomal protein L18